MSLKFCIPIHIRREYSCESCFYVECRIRKMALQENFVYFMFENNELGLKSVQEMLTFKEVVHERN
jgi:hypothetical protein